MSNVLLDLPIANWRRLVVLRSWPWARLVPPRAPDSPPGG